MVPRRVMVSRRAVLSAVLAATLSATLVGFSPVTTPRPAPSRPAGSLALPPAKQPVATGSGGAVATVDADATRAGIDVLRKGGNAVDAAVAAAAALGVTEPYSGGIGGGGYLVYYDARTRRVHTVDGRETAPKTMGEKAFIDPVTGRPLPMPEAVTSGLSVGAPGVVRTWEYALRHWGTLSLGKALSGPADLAERGFVVDQTFRDQTRDNEARFRDITPSRALFLPGGRPPEVGARLRNPDLAATYRLLGREGGDAFYSGPLAADIVRTVEHPPMDPKATRTVRPGLLRVGDLVDYGVVDREPTRVGYRGLDVYGMGPSSSGGSTLGEALNILENYPLASMPRTEALHHYLEASRLAYADRNRWVGDPDQVKVPLSGLLSESFAKERACLINPRRALTSPLPAGNPGAHHGKDCPTPGGPPSRAPHEGLSTTHLVVTDRWGNVAAYTLSIEQTGGSALTVPGRGFLLNNELTDFTFAPKVPGVPEPNLPAPRKRPRSSMAPSLVLKDGRPVLALGSPGGATIITTVLQILLNRLDFGMGLPEAVAAPRASQRNAATTEAEPEFLALPERASLEALGQRFTSLPQIGAATGVEFLGGGRMRAVAEPRRRGGGSAMVVTADPPRG